MMFIDQTEIFIRSGKGGRGIVSFRAGKHQPKAGADGGDGGFGGNVYLVGESSLNTLSHLRHRQRYLAEDGEKGGANDRTGRSGEDLYIKVPLGTIAHREDNGELVAEVLAQGQRVLIANGGKRGIGNARFLSSRHQAPEETTPGGPSEEFFLKLELKLLADVGFAGFPNAGKSTLLSVISAAKPKIASYPFTTLTPQLGVVDVDRADLLSPKSFVAADIPGLIEGASEGKGLGLDFLRHLERTKVVAYILDPFVETELTVQQQYDLLRKELAHYAAELADKKATVVITKMDLADETFDQQAILDFFLPLGLDVSFVSSATGQGILELKRRFFATVVSVSHAEPMVETIVEDIPVPELPKLSDYRMVQSIRHLGAESAEL